MAAHDDEPLAGVRYAPPFPPKNTMMMAAVTDLVGELAEPLTPPRGEHILNLNGHSWPLSVFLRDYHVSQVVHVPGAGLKGGEARTDEKVADLTLRRVTLALVGVSHDEPPEVKRGR